MPDQLVTIGSYSTPYEASLVRGELEAFNIDATLADENTVSINWLWSNALGGVKVQVPESEVAEALGVLRTGESDEPDGQDMPQATLCPVCGSADTHYYLDKRGSFLTWLVLGIPVMPAISKRECAGCGHKWKA
jgi:hypothetical protein